MQYKKVSAVFVGIPPRILNFGPTPILEKEVPRMVALTTPGILAFVNQPKALDSRSSLRIYPRLHLRKQSE